MPREFEKFGRLKTIAKKIVDKDDLPLCNRLYSSLNSFTTKAMLTYQEDFWVALNNIQIITSPVIIITRIQLYDQDENKNASYHAVALLKQGRKFYMFDPNGVFTQKDRYSFKQIDIRSER